MANLANLVIKLLSYSTFSIQTRIIEKDKNKILKSAHEKELVDTEEIAFEGGNFFCPKNKSVFKNKTNFWTIFFCSGSKRSRLPLKFGKRGRVPLRYGKRSGFIFFPKFQVKNSPNESD